MINNEVAHKLTLKGTTTVGVKCKDGVVLASDTRVTMGGFIAHRHGKKIYQIDNHLAMTIAGSVADAQRAVDILIANAKLYKLNLNRPLPIKSAARLLSNLLFSNRYMPLLTQILLGGVDDSGPHIFSLDPFGSLIEETFASTGSGSPVAYGVLEDRYRDGMSIEELTSLVVKAVNSAMKRNTATGDNFNVAVITSEGYKELTEEEKKRY